MNLLQKNAQFFNVKNVQIVQQKSGSFWLPLLFRTNWHWKFKIYTYANEL